METAGIIFRYFFVYGFTVNNLMLGNVDWLVILGFTMNPVGYHFLFELKPQIGIGIVLYWLWTSYKIGGIILSLKFLALLQFLLLPHFYYLAIG